MSTARTNRRRHLVLYLVIAIACIAVLSAYFVLVYARTPPARSRQNQDSPIVGTWVGKNGNVLNIRADGTGRSRSSGSMGHFAYFEWTLVSREFRIFQYSRKHSFGWFARRALLDDTPTDCYEVI